MDTFGYTNEYLTKNGEPWFPVMGEMHYSRYPADYWRESLLKMKAGGVEVVSSYVIWIHHEEIEGTYDFTGDRDLAAFVRTAADCGLFFILRIGPWSHAEVRNGGFPDWLVDKPFDARTNDPGYLAEVARFYGAIAREVSGLFLRDGGPIIGVQVENEFGHCGGLSGPDGETHMRTLAALARDAGIDVPLWTATGWGGAVTGGMIPVMGGYCEAPWDQRLTDIEPSGNYIFTHERNDHNIGSDYGFGTGITFDIGKFPYLTAELGGGLQVTRHRRPRATARDIGAMTLVKLGSGVNLLGYYMYHGGTNPRGKLTTLQESRATGSINDLPELSYDFRAPVREYGQVSDTLRELKLFALFARDFGRDLCRMPAFIPPENPLFPSDSATLRRSWRHDGVSGYLFVNNYQRRRKQASHERVSLVAPVPSGPAFPPIDVRDGEYFFLPFNMRVGNATLETALVTPLCVFGGERKTYVFYAAFAQAEELLARENYGALYRFVDDAWPTDADVMTLSRKDALDAWRANGSIAIETGFVLEDGGRAVAVTRKPGPPVRFSETAGVESPDGTAYRTWTIQVPPWTGDDCFLRIAWEGDVARLTEKETLVADDFCLGAGHVWEIGLKRFGPGSAHEFTLELEPLTKDTRVYLETWPRLDDGVACRVLSIESETEVSRNLD